MILALLTWLVSLFISGYLLSNILVETNRFLERIAYSLALGSCVVVVVFFARTFVPFPVASSWMIFAAIGIILFTLNLTSAKPFSFPRPSRIEATFLLLLAIQVSMVATTLTKFPLFSPFALADPTYRIDYLATGSNVIAYATQGPPTIQGQLLYYAVHYHLAYLYALTPHPNILQTDRLGMGILTVFSTFYLYLMSKRIFNSETKALAVVAVYSLSGFLWVGMVLNAQLFPNFYGLMIATPFLIVAVKDILNPKTPSFQGLVLVTLALFNALMSHYSTLLFFPILALVVMRTAVPMKSRITVASILLFPLMVGFSFFYSLLVGFASGGATGGPDLSASWLAIHTAFLPSLSYALLFITNDFASVMIFAFISVYIYSAIKERNAWGALPGLAFAFVIFASPQTLIAWRFAFIALLPLTLMVGSGLHSVADRVFSWLWETKGGKVKIRFARSSGLTLLSCFSVILLISPIVYNSWGANTLAFSSYDINQNSRHDFAVYNAMQWMKNQTPGAFFYTANDGKFTASRLLVGPGTDFVPSLLSNPESAFAYGLHHQAKPIFAAGTTPDGFAYNITAKTFPVYFIATSANPPFPCVQYDVRLTPLNATSGHAVKLRAEIFDSTGYLFKQNVTSFVYANATQILKMTIINGNTTGTLSFAKSGRYDVKVVAGTIPSDTLTLFMGSYKNPLSTPIDIYACYPWAWGHTRPFSSLPIVYDDKTDVRIYEVAG